MCVGIWTILNCLVLIMFYTGIITADLVSVSCGHIENSPVNVLNLTQFHRENISDFTLNVTSTAESNVFIESECCNRIALSSSSCSRRCTPQGMRVCHLIPGQSLQLDLNACLGAASVNVTCISAVYTTPVSSTTSISAPVTASTNSARTPASDTSTITLPSGSPVNTGTPIVIPPNTTETSVVKTATSPLPTQTNPPVTVMTSDSSINLWNASNNVSSVTTTDETGLTSYGRTTTLPLLHAMLNGTTEEPFDEGQAMKDLYKFLIVLAVVLVLVALLVGVFFIRKRREKASITTEDFPLEYWHNQDYIDSVVEKSFSPKSFTLNPVYNSSSTKENPTHGYKDVSGRTGSAESPSLAHRYKKRDETDHRHHGNDNQGYGPHSAKALTNRHKTATDLAWLDSDDIDDQYVATAAGSNFYSYERQIPEPFTNLDEDSSNEHGPSHHSNSSNGNTGGNSFKSNSGKGARKKKRSGERRRYHDDEDDDGGRKDGMEVYAVSFKNRLKKNLDHWSAEESDV